MNAVLNDAHVTAWLAWLERLEAQLWTLDGFNSHVAEWVAQLPKNREQKQYEDAFPIFEKISELLHKRNHIENTSKSEGPLGIEAADRLIPKLDEEVRTLYLSIGLGPDGKTAALPVVAIEASAVEEPDAGRLAVFQPQTTTPSSAPVVVVGSSNGLEPDKAKPEWNLKPSIERAPGYRWPLYQALKAAHVAGQPCPKARGVLNAWAIKPPPELQVMPDGVKYNDGLGNLKEANLKAIQQAIKNLLK